MNYAEKEEAYSISEKPSGKDARGGSSSRGTVRIYEVPKKHRSKNLDAYTPRLVSIGLLHYGESQLQGMEDNKMEYASHFSRRFGVTWDKLPEQVSNQLQLVCNCYPIHVVKALNQPEKNLHEIIFTDGAFIVELFLKNHFIGMREKGDFIFDNPWVSNDVLHDLLLFENQLPFRFLATLFNTFVSVKNYNNLRKSLDDDVLLHHPPSFEELAHKYFSNVGNTGKVLLANADFRPTRHLLEFLFVLHQRYEDQNRDRPSFDQITQQVDEKTDLIKCPTATELNAAGVKFRYGKGKKRLCIGFDNDKGILTIPRLVVNDLTETFFRNMVAFEQSGNSSTKFISNSVILLDNLIDTPKDVEILVKHKIFKNELGTNQQVADLFNNLYKEFLTDPMEFDFAEEVRDLNKYRRTIWHRLNSNTTKWLAILRRDYFHSPWSIIGVVGGALILILTVIQTVCSLIPIFKKGVCE
ncbi:OLC1v1035756C1 [Oldenlandia corymbosa var. corymbosa]|uniref:OLC1v1035756C1 n=1 Tax=Oldenlandia corymbosa var. corymbosa TaxID=529605 RepID=A0AAV1CX47_OLDCO|nr:OLC1v1035756C1 [Oldenlandia corymbosa var. corymbosa]